MEDPVMSGFLRFSLKDLVGEIVKWMCDLCVSGEEICKASRYVFNVRTVSFIHSFANFTQYLFDKEQNGRLCKLPKDESSRIWHLPQVIVPSG